MAQDSHTKGLDEELAASGAAMDRHCSGLQMPCDPCHIVIERHCPTSFRSHNFPMIMLQAFRLGTRRHWNASTWRQLLRVVTAARMTTPHQRAAAAKQRVCGSLAQMTDPPEQLSRAATCLPCPPTVHRAWVMTNQAHRLRRQRDIWRRHAGSTQTAMHCLRMPAQAPLIAMPRPLRLQSQRRKDRHELQPACGAG